MKTPSLGQFADGGTVEIDLPKLLETRLLIQANSGGGKSWAIRRLIEQTAGQVQQFIIDPEGEFATLREKHDFVIAAAHDGDALAHPKTAAVLARRLLETGVSAVLDIYDLKANERQGFVKIFLDALVNAPKSLWQPCIVVLDEAHVFCPEAGKSESAGSVIDLATRGRKRGFCLVAATQRLAKLHKDTAAELLNKLIGRTGLDVDVQRAADELGMTKKETLAALRDPGDGNFFAFGPALSRSVRMLHVGGVHTTHPRAGERTLKAPPKPTAAIVAVLPKLADLPKEAEQEIRNLEDARREVAQLRRELAAAKAARPGSSAEDVKAADLTGYERGRREMAGEALRELAKVSRDLHARLRKAVDDAFVFKDEALAKAPLPPAPAPRYAPTNGVEKINTPPTAAADGDLTGPEQRIVDAIAWLESTTAQEECEQTVVAFLANYTYGAGSFNNPKGRLNARGLVAYVPGNRIKLTPEGRSLARAPAEVLTAAELHKRILDRLPGPEGRVLRPLLDAYPSSMDGTSVAAAANYQYGAGSFNNPRGRLKSLGLIEYLGGGELRAAASLFPGAP